MRSASESTTLDTRNDAVRLAYDSIASNYDRAIAGDYWMRQHLWRHYLSTFHTGDRVLDVACGTGLDAVYLAKHGIQVTAIDVSPGMIECLDRRANAEGLTRNIDTRVLSIDELDDLPADSFDGIISAFAGLSTLPDLHDFAQHAARLLRPGGHMVVHILNQFSLWEWLLLVRARRWAEARALGTFPERDFIIGDVPVRHYLHRPDALYRCVFADRFALVRAYGLGCLRPPHTLRAIPNPIVRGLGALDARFGARRLLRGRGRFFVLDLSKRSDDGQP